MGWSKSEDIYEVFQKLSPPAIVVTVAGNEFPERLEDVKTKASKNFDAIIVGSFSPKGFVSDFSNSGEEVHILAPSDNWITSAGINREYEKFGGTSGATPLVTGSLAAFEWLSGYHPTSNEAKILLEKTATPTLHSHEEPQVNGVGLLNAYKLGEVAKRLKQKCKDKSLFCFKEEILNAENYHFDLEKWDKDLKKDLSKAFPNCVTEKKPVDSSEVSNCEEKGEVFKRLRKAVLLNPKESRELLKSLSCIYEEGGFVQNTEALNKLTLALGSIKEVRADVKILAKKEKPVSDEILRLMLGMGGGFEEELESIELDKVIEVAAGVGGMVALPLVEEAFKTGDLELQKKAVIAAGKIGKPGLPLLEEAFRTGNFQLQKTAVYAAGKIGEPGLLLVEEAFKTGNLNLQNEAVIAAGKIGEPGLPLVKEAFKTGNLDLQNEALRATHNIGEPGLPLVEEAFKISYLHEAAVIAAYDIKKPALPLLRRVLNDKNLSPEVRQKIEKRIKWIEQR